MKQTHWILKLAAAVLLLGAAACAIAVYWDKLVDIFYTVCDRIEEWRADSVASPSEFDDYDDGALLEN